MFFELCTLGDFYFRKLYKKLFASITTRTYFKIYIKTKHQKKNRNLRIKHFVKSFKLLKQEIQY